jgi:hypothetical protein
MVNCKLPPFVNPFVRAITPFDIGDLKCEALVKLFLKTALHMQDIRIERVTRRRRYPSQEEHPAMTLGITVQRPTIRFADWLDREQRIDAIAHELLHILLVYGYGLRMIHRAIPCSANNHHIFDGYSNLNRHWDYFLTQTVNTVHHQILIDYLKEEYGIESKLHLTLFRHNSRIVFKSHYADKESQYAKGLIAFEHGKCMDNMSRVLTLHGLSDFSWRAYSSARKRFWSYSAESIPAPSTYEEDVFSFLEDLGYRRQDFRFVPLKSLGPSSTEERLKQNV